MSSAPSAPDPYATANAQTQSNQNTAAYNAALNRVSTYTPYGNQVYSQTGTDSSGAPQYSDTISLTPASQQQLDTQQAQDNGIAQAGLALTNQIQSGINSPLPDAAATGQGAQDAYYANETRYLDPQYANLQNDQNASLANKGVIQGSDAYNRAQTELANQRTQAYGQAQDSAIQAGQTTQAQALANAITIKNQPINQLASLRSGTAIQNPSFPTTPTSNSANTDVSGIINNSYAQQVQAANANNPFNGLFSLGSAALTKYSDRRLKRNIERIGRSAVLGLPIYAFRYVWGGAEQIGVMAQDVLKVAPEAVLTMPDGYMAVNYGALA